MMRNTSAVAFSRSSASSRSQVRWSSCFFRSAPLGLRRLAAVDALLRFGLVGLRCCAFAGLRFTVPRRLTSTSRWQASLAYHIGDAVVQHSIDRPLMSVRGQKHALPQRTIYSRCALISRHADCRAPERLTPGHHVQCIRTDIQRWPLERAALETPSSFPRRLMQ